MEMNLIWPDISYIKMIANDRISKKILNETIVESGRSRLLANLRELYKKEHLQTLRIFVPHINKSEYKAINLEIIRLIKKHKKLQIDWFLTDEISDAKNIKMEFGKTIPSITFSILKEYEHDEDNLELTARYFIARAFIGEPKTGNFDTTFLKKAISLFIESNKKKNVQVPLHFRYNQPSIEGVSAPMKKLKKRINMIADTDLNVLIKGETGAGKEGVAFFLHDLSKRNKTIFEAINCALFNEEFLISELFGHKKGAFTGAQQDRPGIIKKMGGGTLFLDELPEMSKQCQAMLLRFLQDGRIKPMGSDCYDDYQYNVRIICAGQPHLLKKNIREDLLYRIGEVKIVVPALKDIVEDDMLLLVDHCLYKESRESKKRYEVRDFFIKNLPIFEKYSWPGNVRQLFSFVKRRLKIGVEEESEILKEIKDEDAKKKGNSLFMEDLQTIISKNRGNLPSSENLKLSYTHYVSRELTEKNQKHIAKKVLQISESTRKKHLEEFQKQL